MTKGRITFDFAWLSFQSRRDLFKTVEIALKGIRMYFQVVWADKEPFIRQLPKPSNLGFSISRNVP